MKRIFGTKKMTDAEKAKKRLFVGRPDRAAVQYAKLTDEEAAARVSSIKQQIRDTAALENLTKDPANIARLRELKSELHWLKANKNRSKYFKIVTSGPSMRRATRYARFHGAMEMTKGDKNVKNTGRKGKNR